MVFCNIFSLLAPFCSVLRQLKAIFIVCTVGAVPSHYIPCATLRRLDIQNLFISKLHTNVEPQMHIQDNEGEKQKVAKRFRQTGSIIYRHHASYSLCSEIDYDHITCINKLFYIINYINQSLNQSGFKFNHLFLESTYNQITEAVDLLRSGCILYRIKDSKW